MLETICHSSHVRYVAMIPLFKKDGLKTCVLVCTREIGYPSHALNFKFLNIGGYYFCTVTHHTLERIRKADGKHKVVIVRNDGIVVSRVKVLDCMPRIEVVARISGRVVSDVAVSVCL